MAWDDFPERPKVDADSPHGIVPISKLFEKKQSDEPGLLSRPKRAPLEPPGDLGKGLTKAKIRYGIKWLFYHAVDIIVGLILLYVVWVLIKMFR